VSVSSDEASERFRALVNELVRTLDSRAQVGELLGLSPSYVAKIARGEAGRIRIATVNEVARRLHLPVGFFDADVSPEKLRQIAIAADSRTLSKDFTTQPVDIYDALKRLDERELRAVHAWLTAWIGGAA
jgi:transcriptional regulator with XRE-family HTH domain